MENNEILNNEKIDQTSDTVIEENAKVESANEPFDKNVRLMSPARMVLRRFFRSKLSVVGLCLLVSLFAFCWLGPVLYTQWGSSEADMNGKLTYTQSVVTYVDDNGNTVTFAQVIETTEMVNSLAKPSLTHPLGTDKNGYDVLARIMKGGQISLTISFLAVFVVTFFGIIFGGVAGFFGGVVDNVIMRICDILMCLPGFPILLIVGTLIDAMDIPLQYRIYYLMGFLTLISWSGTARLVR